MNRGPRLKIHLILILLLFFFLSALGSAGLGLAASAPAREARLLMINGHEVRLEYGLLQGEEGLLAPLEELLPYLGAELRRADRGYAIRFGLSEEALLPQERLYLKGEVSYVPLEALARLLGARLLLFPDSVYLFGLRSELRSLAYSHAEGAVRLRFSRLAPLKLASKGRTIEVRFFNAVLGIAPRTSRFSQGAVAALELYAERGDQLLLRLELRRAGRAELQTGFSSGGYQVELRFSFEAEASSPKPESPVPLRLKRAEQLRLKPWLSYHFELRETPAGPVRVYYLLVEDYQAHAHLRVAIPQGGLGRLARLEMMVAAQGGLGGINANFFDPASNRPIGLLIQDGKLLSPPYGRRAALGVDLFGKVVIFEEAHPPLIPLREVVTGGPRLLKEGKVALDPQREGFSEAFVQARAARSAVGLKPEGDLILLIATKNQGSAGLTLEELALLLQGLGAVEALAFDGGSSASLVFRRGKDLRAIGGREIAVGLVLIPK